jgi:sortase (surface protein transpeptidase)
LAWTDKFRHDNSFFNLPKLKVGDTLEIVYQQRKYTYEVYAENTGPEIMDYTADLILYTCENLTGDTRIFKYARLINL